jgi:two-component system, NtrC family, response regulator GlrR
VDREQDLASSTWVVRVADATEALRVRKFRLEVVAGPDAGKSAICGATAAVIGRSQSDLVLTDVKCSALHAEIRLDEQGYRLRDLGSTNGTFVWGMRIVEAYLAPGTILGIGDSAIRFEPLPEAIDLPIHKHARFGGLVGKSAVMRRLFEQIDRVAATDMTVLITGETGSGKELVAEAIHEHSPRASGPFVVLDCAATPPRLFEDRLFGHEAGAFTDAKETTRGVFEAAHGGTLFLDEIGELALEVQAKLLRAVETHTVRRIGSHQPIECDVRIVAATNRDLSAEVNRQTFRSDLYFRLITAHLRVPPLRERKDDVELLVRHFLTELGRGELPEGFLEQARLHEWPGNVRELRNAVERATVMGSMPDVMSPPADPARLLDVDLAVPFKVAKGRLVDEFDRRYVTALLEAHDWNIASAARAAGLDRMSIYKMLDRLGIRRDDVER